MKILRKTIGLLGFCPSCLRWQGVHAFRDYVCTRCYEREEDQGGIKKIMVAIVTLILSYFGYGDYSDKVEKLGALEEKVELLEEMPLGQPLGGNIDNGLPPLYNPKYWSPDYLEHK